GDVAPTRQPEIAAHKREEKRQRGDQGEPPAFPALHRLRIIGGTGRRGLRRSRLREAGCVGLRIGLYPPLDGRTHYALRSFGSERSGSAGRVERLETKRSSVSRRAFRSRAERPLWASSRTVCAAARMPGISALPLSVMTRRRE